MEILYLMVLCSVSLAVVFLVLFIYGMKKGQFDDDESPAVRMLLDNQVSNDETKDMKPQEKNNK
ncbi:MAG: cbb3-type cytochrome oxidase assembly protein CcoS [Flavobacteriaceae bacterium]|jgi:cbb3-type cytochrome oxidase maturation protein|nr:cbb3-type cytochrome oxidase assembly protein CcoS [Flavobacteriaceae bacterium]